MKQTKNPLVSLEINDKVIHLKENKVSPFLKPFVKYINLFLTQNFTHIFQQNSSLSITITEA